jgi:hypothetical protein
MLTPFEVNTLLQALWNFELSLRQAPSTELRRVLLAGAVRKLGGRPDAPRFGPWVPRARGDDGVDITAFDDDERRLMASALEATRVWTGQINDNDQAPVEGLKLTMLHLEALRNLEQKVQPEA